MPPWHLRERRELPRNRIPELLLEQGRVSADSIRRSGEIWANAISQGGAGIGRAIAEAPEHREREEERRARTEERLAMAEERSVRTDAMRTQAEDQRTLRGALESSQAREEVLARTPGHLRATVQKHWDEADERANKLDAAKLEYLGGLAATVKSLPLELRAGALAGAVTHMRARGYETEAGEAEKLSQMQPQQVEAILDSYIKRSPTQRKLVGEEEDRALRLKTFEGQQADRTTDNARQAATLAETMRHNRAVEAKPPAGSQTHSWVMRPNAEGKLEAVRVREDEIRPGDKPANTREQGRSVTSGDAGRLSDVSTSLSQVKALRDQLGNLGTASRVGAALPDVLTEATGLGAESKATQGVIERVKQIIGKTLEGGVLRKEDEAKYAKILPKIGDTPAVAKSKLDGLEAALRDKGEALLVSLEDAGYDVTKYRERETKTKAKADPLGLR